MKIQKQFTEIITLIKEARYETFKTVNNYLINLYWDIGDYISHRTDKEGWGKSTVEQLAKYIQKQESELKGFSDKNLWRMKQFYEAYKDYPKLSTLLRDLSWTNNLIILSRTKSTEEREFYLRLCIQEKYSKRELERQINSSVFERTILDSTKLSPAVRVLQQDLRNIFKETYVFEFLNLPEPHTETDLQKGLIKQLKSFVLELGKDFLFVGEEYRIQVGNSDFFLDLLFFHRELQCLVAFELKTDKFKPEHLGQLNFYLEALDRDVKKANENPRIGILLCKDKDNEVVEYAMSRNLSPALISQYTLVLPDKKFLQAKLHEFFELYDQQIGLK